MAREHCQTQLIWDRDRAGTAQAPGCSLEIGPPGHWSPERLLTAAVEADLMATFLSLASEAGVDVLGYVSAAEAEWRHGAPERPSLVVRPCIVVGRERDRAPVGRLVELAGERSAIARALGDTLKVLAEIVVVPRSEPG